MADAPWIDLLDPSPRELRQHLPRRIHEDALERLTAPPAPDVRPSIQGRGNYVFGVLLAAVAVPEEDRVYYQEVDFVVTEDTVLTVRKTPAGERPFGPERVREICARREHVSPGMVVFHLVDDIAERYLDLLDALDGEIDELEEGVDTLPARELQRRLSDLRHDLLHIRRTLAPTRDAVRGIVDGRVDIEGRPLFRREVFTADVERQFQGVYDKFLRATESLELQRDLIGTVRDYHQTKIATDQNEVMKRLTAIASLLLLPTFIVGLYGQNFRHHFPELDWQYGYAWSWALIFVSTVAQLAFFRWKRWI